MDCTNGWPIIDVTTCKPWPPCPEKPTIDLTGYTRMPPNPLAKQIRAQRIATLGDPPKWKHRPDKVFHQLTQQERWSRYDELFRELGVWENELYAYHERNPYSNYRIPECVKTRIQLERYDLRDAFLAIEGPNSSHPAISSILYEHECRKKKRAMDADCSKWAWDLELKRIASLPRDPVRAKNSAPSIEELHRRRIQSQLAKRSNGIDYSKSKRQRQSERVVFDDEDYECSPGDCQAPEPGMCGECRNVSSAFKTVVEVDSASFA